LESHAGLVLHEFSFEDKLIIGDLGVSSGQLDRDVSDPGWDDHRVVLGPHCVHLEPIMVALLLPTLLQMVWNSMGNCDVFAV